jgi:hypothetical protein
VHGVQILLVEALLPSDPAVLQAVLLAPLDVGRYSNRRFVLRQTSRDQFRDGLRRRPCLGLSPR